jgi:hypothetical protein
VKKCKDDCKRHGADREGSIMDAAAWPKFRLCLLGRFKLNGPKGFVDLPNKKLTGLLAYLACTAPTPQHREKLATLLWGLAFRGPG